METCSTCEDVKRVEEIGDRVFKLIEDIEDDAPCLAAILSAIGLLWSSGDFKAIHFLADGLAVTALAKAAKMKDDGLKSVFLTGMNAAMN